MPKLQLRRHDRPSAPGPGNASTSAYPLRCRHADPPHGDLRRPFHRRRASRRLLRPRSQQGPAGCRVAAAAVRRHHQSQTSVHLMLTVQGEIKELPIESLDGDLTNTPAVAAQGKANILFLGQRLQDVSFVVADGTSTAPSRQATPSRTSDRRSTSTTSRRSCRPTRGWPTCWPTSPTPRPTAARPINGVDTVRITGTVSADAVNKIAPQIGADRPRAGHRVDHRGRQPRTGAGQAGADPGNSVTMTLSEWGKPVTVTKPAV